MTNVTPGARLESISERPSREAHSSGVSWGAVIAGAFVTASFSLILLALGAGLGLSAVSPWSNTGESSTAVDAMAIGWLILIEIVASALGGYLTGRLRIKWALIHNDEVYFRDTANGFLAWAVALVISVTFLASAATSMVGHVAQDRSENGARSAALPGEAYFVDALFRSDRTAPETSDASVKAEAGRIMVRLLAEDQSSAADQSYLARLVAGRTGIDPADAAKRVSDVIADARRTEDAARRATAHLLLWVFLALLMGAFCASLAATIGGHERDHVKLV